MCNMSTLVHTNLRVLINCNFGLFWAIFDYFVGRIWLGMTKVGNFTFSFWSLVVRCVTRVYWWMKSKVTYKIANFGYFVAIFGYFIRPIRLSMNKIGIFAFSYWSHVVSCVTRLYWWMKSKVTYKIAIFGYFGAIFGYFMGAIRLSMTKIGNFAFSYWSQVVRCATWPYLCIESEDTFKMVIFGYFWGYFGYFMGPIGLGMAENGNFEFNPCLLIQKYA